MLVNMKSLKVRNKRQQHSRQYVLMNPRYSSEKDGAQSSSASPRDGGSFGVGFIKNYHVKTCSA